MSSCTSAAAVVNRTRKPCWQAARPRASPMWVLPVPEFPKAKTFSRLPIHSHRARSSTSFLFNVGMSRKLYVSRLLLTGNFAALIRRSVARRSRSIISDSTSRSKNTSKVAPSERFEFAYEKSQLLKILEADWNARTADAWKPHPMFGKMTPTEWGKLLQIHVDYHLR